MADDSDNRVTVLESIVQDVSKSLFQKWANTLPEDQRSQEAVDNLSKNATETTYFVVQLFMNKFNEAAEELKDK